MTTLRLLVLLALLWPAGSPAQVTAGTDLTVQSDLIWRGLTRSNRASFQPSMFVGLRRGSSLFTAGAWASLEPFEPDPTELSNVGIGGDALGELDFWAQWDWRLIMVATLDVTVGWVAYTFHGEEAGGGRGSEWNTHEVYVGAKLSDLRPINTLLGLPPELPLGFELSAWKDLDAIGGLYGEAVLEADLPILPFGEPISSVLVGLTSGWSFGQRVPPDSRLGHYDGNGPTHLDLSISTVLFFPLGAAGVTVFPAGHLQIGFDDATVRRGRSPEDRARVFPWSQLTVSVLYPLRRVP